MIKVNDIVMTIDKGIFGQKWLIQISGLLKYGWFNGYVIGVEYPEDEFWRLREFSFHTDDIARAIEKVGKIGSEDGG